MKTMHIICLTPLEEGVYNDHYKYNITEPPEGWAMIPPNMALPSTFPRLGEKPEVQEITYTYDVEVQKINEETGKMETVKEQRERTILTVTKMTEGTLPDPVEPEPTETEQLRADVDYLAIMTGVEL